MALEQDYGTIPVPMENVPGFGQYVRIQGTRAVLTADENGQPMPFLRRNEQMVVKFTPHIKSMIEHGWADMIDLVEYPAANQYFPTLADVLRLIEQQATTLPGEAILGAVMDGETLVLQIGLADGTPTHEVRVTLPQLVDMQEQIVRAEGAADRSEYALAQIMRLVADAAQAAADAVTSDAEQFAALASAAAAESVSSAEEAQRIVDSIGVIKGPPGPPGPKGDRGDTGAKGATGAAGAPGAKGEPGEKGDPGKDGKDGASVAYEGMVDTYAALPTGLKTEDKGKGWVVNADGRIYVWDGAAFPAQGAAPLFRGPVGATGPKGDKGDPGAQGVTGAKGDPGTPGATGAKGDKGEPGPTGPKGDKGPQGAVGPQGATGLPGADGRPLVLRGEVASSASLPTVGMTAGDTYVLSDTGKAVMWLGSAWSSPVTFVGPTGPQGERGLRGEPGATGPTGPKGDKGDPGRLDSTQTAELFGSSSYTKKPAGILRWSGPWYNPPTGFMRLKYNADGRLRVHTSENGGAVASSDTNCYLYAPVTGTYLLSACQCWGTDTGARGTGLTTNINDGAAGVALWVDIGIGRIATGTKVCYLTGGTRLYPWTFSDNGSSGMAPDARGQLSEFSITLLRGA